MTHQIRGTLLTHINTQLNRVSHVDHGDIFQKEDDGKNHVLNFASLK